MRFSKFFLVLVLLFGFQKGFGQVFTVTSRDDAGPGTLRAALSTIPANTPSYTIKFNLPGAENEANRTIRLRTALPSIPSNVVIDGASQENWSSLGVSGAKIIIEPEINTSTFHGLSIGTNIGSVYTQTVNVAIYGLFIRNFARINNFQTATGNQAGIQIDYRASGIKIGAAGKGNVICGNIYGINITNNTYYGNVSLANITIQSNLIGVMYDGETANPNVTGINANLYDSSLTIGGDNSGDGNVISANLVNVNVTKFYSSTNARFPINIINNKIGTNYAGTTDYRNLALFQSASSLGIYGIKVDASLADLYIRKNIISGNRTWGVSIANADFVMTENRIGAGAGAQILGNGGGIKIETGATGTVGGTAGGGTTADEGNIIANNDYGLESVSSKPVKITRNSFYCNKIFGIGPSLNNQQAYAQILVQEANRLEGRANPNSEVELFYTVNCNDNCEGREYFRTVQTGSDGRWKYIPPATQPLTGNVTVTASLLNYTTSQFSTAGLLAPGTIQLGQDDYIVTPITCNGNGSIKIPEPRIGYTFQWYKIEPNNTRLDLGQLQEISNLAVGNYEVIINDGCKAITSKPLEIKDQKLLNLNVTWPTPICAQTSFPFSALVDRGVLPLTYRWKNVITNVEVIGQNVNMPQGTYRVTVTDAAGCSLESTEHVTIRLPSPIINTLNRIVGPAACGAINGSISNIIVTDITGSAVYKWFRMDYNPLTGVYDQGPQVGSQLALTGAAGGLYMLQVKDEGPCPAVQSSYITIPITNSVVINGTPFPTTCLNDNGAYRNVTITGADRYELKLPDGTIKHSGTYTAGMILNFPNLKAGANYRFRAYNFSSNCSNEIPFNIDITNPTVYSTTDVTNPTTCGDTNGAITITFANNTPVPVSYIWTNASGNLIQNQTNVNPRIRSLTGLSPGVYTMTAFDANGCTVTFGPYNLSETPLLTVINTQIPPINDGCSLSRGSVTGVTATGGILPYSYYWLNELGQAVRPVQTTPDLIGVPAGKYHLRVKDGTDCGEAFSAEYIVENPPFPIADPVLNGKIKVCYSSDIMINVTAPEEGTYELYSDIEGSQPIMQNKTGIFVFRVSKTGDYYVKRRLGTCESGFTKINVEVTNDNLVAMNTITPNGDGMNDTWVINGLPESEVNIKLYTRSGQLIYEANGKYLKPFDGRFRGQDLPAGVYYYRIDLRADCAPLGGSLTLLR